MKISVDDAYQYCLILAKQHYENFPVASVLLPSRLRKPIAAIYAFARTADDYADEEDKPKKVRLAKLDEWEQNLIACYNGQAEHPIFIALSDTVSRFTIPLLLFQKLLHAFRTDVVKNRYNTWEELLEYCDNSANPIGRLLLHLFGYKDDDCQRSSDAICTALQLTNFWQDLSIDIARNRLYIPRLEIERFHCSEDSILQMEFTPAFRQLMEHIVEHTQNIFDEGKPLLHRVRYPLSLELKLTWLAGTEILALIREQKFNTFQKRPVIHKSTFVSILFRSFFI
ncbi:MAG: squalene synthase HpnC [Bacteroidetes bacterium]|jgi:phytoene synthase|nr:squalene synthase HpnC [Bacteroidota bacterium]HOV98726.1 squalene synthase HpnC [Bacteroidota bacterium]